MPSIENPQNQVQGTDQADKINGTDNNDAILAGDGADYVVAGGGDDYVEGGEGQDTLIGDAPSKVEFDPSSISIVEDYTMTVTFDYEGAGYKNSVGTYKIDPDTGEISGVEFLWENASLAGSGGDLIGGQSSVQVDVAAGEQIGFFIIGNGYNHNDFSALGEGTFEFVNAEGQLASIDSNAPFLRHVAVDGAVTILGGQVYHSTSTQPDHAINSDNMDHTVGTSGDNASSFQIGFEDLHGGGDMDFDDVVFTVEVGAENGAAIVGEIDDGTSGGDDRLEGRSGEDHIEGNSGDDLLVGGGASVEWQLVDGKWVYNAEAVDPSAIASSEGEDDVIIGGSGDDVLLGNGGDDALYGGAGEDRFNGGWGNDKAYGGSDNDIINLQQGDDYAEGNGGADTINAGQGDDTVYGDNVGDNILRSDASATSFNDLAALDSWESYTDDTTGMTTIVQEIETVEGEPYELTFEVAANLGAGFTSGTIEVLYNGQVVDTVDVTSGVFESHTISFDGTGGPGSISFRNIETSAEADAGAPQYDTSGPIFSYDSTLTTGRGDVDVSAFAPGQANLYQVINDQFKVFDTEAGAYTDVGEPFGFKMNAIGFNVENDLIYGIAKGNGTDSQGNDVSVKDLVAIDAEGNTYRVGETPVGDFVGDFDAEGNLWTFQNGLNRFTKIDVENLDADGNPTVQNFYPPSDMFKAKTYDVAYNASESAFYAVESPGKNGQSGYVHKIDMSEFDGTNEPVITTVEISGTLVDGEMMSGMSKGAYGAVFLDGDGNLYAGLNKGDHDLDGSTDASGAVFKYDLNFETGHGYAEMLSESENTGSNDGAADPRAADPFAVQDTDNTVLLKTPELVNVAGGDDRLRGGSGDDEMHGGGGDDVLYGHEDNDTLYGDSGDDRMFGGSGADEMDGGTGDDHMVGGADDDLVSGGFGNDRIKGDGGADKLDGGDGKDTLWGGADNDSMSGGEGNDKLYAGSGDDGLSGGSGSDKLAGGAGNDWLDGGSGKDLLSGGADSDILSGGAGTDKLVGGTGEDRLEGGAGTDHLWGGNWTGDGETDTFVYSKGGGKDIIHDFETDHDQIDLSAYGLSYEDVQDRMIDRGWALEINLEGIDKSGAGDKILLKSIKAEDLDSENFII